MKGTAGRLRKIEEMGEREEDDQDEDENICAICQMQIGKNDTTFTCDSECMNSFHLECFSQWAKHGAETNGTIKCPLCRDPKPTEYLDQIRKK